MPGSGKAIKEDMPYNENTLRQKSKINDRTSSKIKTFVAQKIKPNRILKQLQFIDTNVIHLIEIGKFCWSDVIQGLTFARFDAIRRVVIRRCVSGARKAEIFSAIWLEKTVRTPLARSGVNVVEMTCNSNDKERCYCRFAT